MQYYRKTYESDSYTVFLKYKVCIEIVFCKSALHKSKMKNFQA